MKKTMRFGHGANNSLQNQPMKQYKKVVINNNVVNVHSDIELEVENENNIMMMKKYVLKTAKSQLINVDSPVPRWI